MLFYIVFGRKRLAVFLFVSVILSGCLTVRGWRESLTLPLVNSPAPSLLVSDDLGAVVSTEVPRVSETPFPTSDPITLTGTFVCLPKKTSILPDTNGCAYGFLTEAFTYYRVLLEDSLETQFQDGRKVTI